MTSPTKQLEIYNSVMPNETVKDSFSYLYDDQQLGRYNNNNFIIDYAKVEKVLSLLLNDAAQGADINTEMHNFLKYCDNQIVVSINDIEILNATYKYLLELPKNPLTSDNLLKLALYAFANRNINLLLSTNYYQIAKDAIDLGADVNMEYYNGMRMTRPLDEAGSDTGLIKILKSHGARCSTESERFREYYKEQILPKFFFPKKIAPVTKENLTISESGINKIPYIMHHIWLTHPSSPREIKLDQMDIVLDTQEFIKKSDNSWTHIVWTNEKSLIPNSVKTLEANGFEVRSIKDYSSKLKLFEKIEELVDLKLYGIASDTLRYSLIEQFGGVYSDLNFKFSRSIELEMQQYNFFSKDFQNSFFAANPSHPIITKVLEIVERNLYNPPQYIKSINADDIISQTVYTTLLPFGAAYTEASNQDHNIDMVLDLRSNKNFESIHNETCPDYYTLFYSALTSEDSTCLLRNPYNEFGFDRTGMSWLEN